MGASGLATPLAGQRPTMTNAGTSTKPTPFLVEVKPLLRQPHDRQLAGMRHAQAIVVSQQPHDGAPPGG